MAVRRFEGREDVPGIVRAHSRAWREAYDGLLPGDVLEGLPTDPTGADVDRWLEALRENHRGVLVAVADREVRGFADVRWGDAETKPFVGEGEADLKAIYVDPDHWGEGLGTELLEAGIDLLPADVEALRLEALSGNDVGRRFYEARGFEATGTIETGIGGRTYDAIVYARQL